ncbi:sugar phosphorylase [Candidatus Woesearchaeota archaeon]|nr:sugar phosphorylase [Candidatus Woesearchaeota archaeon]
MPMITKPFDFFTQEAKRWYRITDQLTGNLGRGVGEGISRGLGKSRGIGKGISKGLKRTIGRKKPAPKHVRVAFRDKQKAMLSKLTLLYGPEEGKRVFSQLQILMQHFVKHKPSKLKKLDSSFKPLNRFTEKDAILITYPDTVRSPDTDTLKTLKRFSDKHLRGVISTIHVLPFYPYSSDRGFSVKNYAMVKQNFGTWDDVEDLGENFNLMLDGVINHVSSQSRWFKGFLQGDPEYENYFIHYPSKSSITPEQMRKIVRPRTSDLLTEYLRKEGKAHVKTYVWTTFSKDQVDLNYKEPRVLLEIIETLLLYVHHGANMIRLDAVNYLWKELGTSCTHLRQAHVIIQLFRDVLDIVAPSVSLISETNVPHAKNISYFGNSGSSSREAQMVYNFTLPPLVLYTIYKGSCRHISKWATKLKYPAHGTYFNFLASHDGIGLTPASRILPKSEVDFLIAEAKKHGSLVQKKKVGLEKEVPYELNITWWNAVNLPSEPFQVVRYLASRAIALSLKGVSGVYFHSLFGTKNDMETFSRTNINRDINRKNFNAREIDKMLSEDSLPSMIFKKFNHLLRVRADEKAFHPLGGQQVLIPNDQVFSVLRTSIDGKEKILALVNVTDKDQEFRVNCQELGLNPKTLYNIIKDKPLTKPRIVLHDFTMRLKPYEVVWVKSRA